MTETAYDVFLAHDPADAGMAALVTREFEQAGCGVFHQQTIEPGEEFRKQILDALLDSSAVVVLLTRSSLPSSLIAFTVGAAMAWDRPVFVLYDGLAPQEVPDYLQQFSVKSLSELGQVVVNVQTLHRPMTDLQKQVLCEVYGEMQTPTEQLLFNPSRLRKLAEEYRSRSAAAVPEERLARELIRLRKQGKLPRLSGRPEIPAAS